MGTGMFFRGSCQSVVRGVEYSQSNPQLSRLPTRETKDGAQNSYGLPGCFVPENRRKGRTIL